MMKLKFFGFTLFFLLCSDLCAQDAKDTLDQTLSHICDEYFNGFAVSMFSVDSMLYSRGYGYADKERNKAFTTKTIHNIGSVTKTFVAMAVMQLVEADSLDLHKDINTYLPFSVRNPKYPDQAITTMHLATHTSGINDSKNYYGKCYVLNENYSRYKGTLKGQDVSQLRKAKNNRDIELGLFLENYLQPKGDYYKKKNFNNTAPGQAYLYTNVGATLAAYVVESISKIPFDQYVDQYILNPLQMNHSGFSFDDIDIQDHAMLYSQNGAQLPKYHLVTYPDGGMLSNSNDLISYTQEMMRGIQGQGSILGESEYIDMTSVQFKKEKNQSGIFWEILRSGKIAHNGADPGITTMVVIDPKQKLGYVFMTNLLGIDNGYGALLSKIYKLTRDYVHAATGRDE